MGMVACFAPVDAKIMEQLQSDPEQIESFLYPDDGESEPFNYFDVDKSWHCIHFMLCGEVDAGESILSLAILGGSEIGEDVGYGPARIIEASQVREIANALSQIDGDTFKSRYEPKKMQDADIYLADMCVRDGDDAFDYLLQNYIGLVGFYQDAAKRGDGVVAWLC
ncbi:YfbM family protein [Undibacterium sp. Ren11W]|uniref:YfbM family protein n=1 Tax=Undibacterium sp. Ren11W TaxID=3413045 RepID=UPI003BEF908D